MTIICGGIEYREVNVGGEERIIPADVGVGDPLFDDDDLLVEEYYCEHGVFTGNRYGRDYLCFWCEVGERS